jgi:hypothetical protein
MHYVGRAAKALLYILGDIVMAVVARHCVLLVARNGARLWKFGSVTHGLRISQVWFLRRCLGFALVISASPSPSSAISATFVTANPSTKATSCSTRGPYALATTATADR